MSFPAESALPVTAMMRSRSVDTSRLSGRSGIVTIVPSNFHSGLLASCGSCTCSEIGCCFSLSPQRQSARHSLKKDNKIVYGTTHRVHVDPVLFWIVLSARKLCDALALRRGDVVRVTFHLIGGAYRSRGIGRSWGRGRRGEWWRHAPGRRLVTEWLCRV